MDKFDKMVNDFLAKKKNRKKKRKKDDRVKIPNTPDNLPVSNQSPALRTGINKTIADTPMPLGIGV